VGIKPKSADGEGGIRFEFAVGITKIGHQWR
jgi:hypothetical protein